MKQARLTDPRPIIGTSSVIRDLKVECEAIAPSRSTILMTGERGVGKEVFAHYIHGLSPRRGEPLITVNCAGVSESLLESELFGQVRGSCPDTHRDQWGILASADHGTVLLDEIGEMGMRMQTLLLRFLETGEIPQVGADIPAQPLDVRLIAGTTRNLWTATKQKAFREDLYYRLHVVRLTVPPLRERPEDIWPLLRHFLTHFSALEGRLVPALTAEVAAYLEGYLWPGNVRELKNVAELLVVGYAGRSVTYQDLPADIKPAAARQSWRAILTH